MYFKYILFLTLAVAFNGTLSTSLSSAAQKDCTQEEFKCANGKCIWGWNRCDGYQHCEDESDELNCTSCAESAFRCGDGKCIFKHLVCNQYDDCKDGSDEYNCTIRVCGSDEFRCHSGQCIHRTSRCDGLNNCADDSDEENCLECDESFWGSMRNAFKCVLNDKCIPHFKLCNSIKDCPDGSDEDKATCESNKF